MSAASRQDLRRLAAVAEEAGWTVKKTRGGHVVFLAPDRSIPPIYGPSTPSDHRSYRNLEATLRRHGLPIPRR